MTTLSGLSIGSLELEPAFDPYTGEYTVEHEGASSALIVTATKADNNAELAFTSSVGDPAYFSVGTDAGTGNPTVTFTNTDGEDGYIRYTVTKNGTSRVYTVHLINTATE